MHRDQLTQVVAANIRAERARAGLTASALARRVGVHPSYLSLIESTKRVPRLDFIDRLADAIGIPVSRLLDLHGADAARQHAA